MTSVAETTGAGETPATTVLVRFARAGHEAGYPTGELETQVRAVGRSLGIAAVEVSSTPTVIELMVGTLGQRSFTLRTTPSSVDLDRIGALDSLAADLADGDVTVEDAIRRLDRIDGERLDRAALLEVLAYGVAGGALAVVLGGGWRESVGAFLVGLVVGIVSQVRIQGTRGDAVLVPIAALLASLAAALLVWMGLDAVPERVTLAALVVLLPGMTLTIGIRELATNHLLSGLANTAAAGIRLLGLVFGVAAGASIADRWFGDQIVGPVDAFPDATILLAAAVSGIAFTITLRAPYRDAVWMCVAAVLAVAARLAATTVFGKAAGVFAAALVVGVAGAVFARALRRSPLVFIVPGVLVLVPGSAGFQSAADLLEGQTVSGVSAAFDTFVTALAIVYGLIIATILLPPVRDED